MCTKNNFIWFSLSVSCGMLVVLHQVLTPVSSTKQKDNYKKTKLLLRVLLSNNNQYLSMICNFLLWCLHAIIYSYHITGHFCGFGLKRRHLIFADFFFCGLKISAPKKNCLYYRKQQQKRCYDKKNGAHYSDP